jgi:hypothetical protein
MSKLNKKFSKCAYTLEIVSGEKRVYEKIDGFWTDAEYSIYANSYTNDLASDIKRMGKWVKIIDMKDYKTSTVVDLISEHIKWCKNNGLEKCLLVVGQAITKLQMTRSTKDVVPNEYFETIDEAKAYAKSLGY